MKGNDKLEDIKLQHELKMMKLKQEQKLKELERKHELEMLELRGGLLGKIFGCS